MKKLLCILTTLAMTIGAFSCSDKKSDKDSVWEEAVLETPFITLNDENFSTINVTPTFSEDEPPVSFGSIDVGELDFGEKSAPVQRIMIIRSIIPSIDNTTTIQPDTTQRMNYQMMYMSLIKDMPQTMTLKEIRFILL